MRTRVVIVTLILLALVTLPYLYAARAAGPDYVFGGFLFNPADGNSYLAKMYQGWRGEWRFRLPYTARPGDGAYLFLFYLFLGHLARLSGLSLPLTFHLARLVGAVFLVLALYRFLRALRFEERWFGLVFALAALGSGMGWLVFPFGTITADFWVAEAYPFLSAYVNPHFSLGLALLLWLALPTGESDAKAKFPSTIQGEWLSGLMALLLALISPFGVVVALILLGGSLLWKIGWSVVSDSAIAGKSWGQRLFVGRVSMIVSRLLWVLLGGAPVLVYDFWVAHIDPVLAIWNAQNLTPTPPFWDLLLALSPALLLALPGAWTLWRRRGKGGLPLVWVALGFLLVYLPFGLQRRFMMGLFVPVVGLASHGLGELAARLGRRAGLATGLSFALSLPTNVLLLLVALHGIQTHDPLIYLTRGEAQALVWVEANTPPNALILAAPKTGMFIPAHTGRQVIYGHPFETANAGAEEEAVTWFFQDGGQDPAAASAFLVQREVNYVFYGPRERELGDLPGLDGLRSVYSQADVTIYQVFVERAAR